MPGPARAGALIYAKDLPRLSQFYQQLLTMRRRLADDEHHVLESADFQLIVHAIPPQIAAGIVLAEPPAPRENSAMKLFFSVPDLADAAALMARLGGCLFEPVWAGPGFAVRNGCDPEGNILQLRQWHAQA
jgi:predicted enzyme related to lactoylglutathione lyase